MQYEAVILELMSRIKALESDVSNMKDVIHSLENAINPVSDIDMDISVAPTSAAAFRNTTPYTKMTEHMMDVCYFYGKKAYQTPGANIGEYANAVASETGMNRNSAIMYIHAVKDMLEGTVFKRAISTKAMKKYFSAIYNEFGKSGLSNAITAARAHIEYRHNYNLPADSIIALCDEFQNRI